MMPSPQATTLSVCLCAVLSLSCDDGRPDLTGPSRVASLVVQPFTASLEVGQTLKLTPVIRDSNGIILGAYPVTWTTSDPEVARISSAGLVTAMRSGSATITAFADGERATANIIVLTPVAVVEITPDSPVIAAGTSLQLTATVLAAGGIRVTGRVVSWLTSDPGVATVSVGKVRGRTPGSALIEATAGDARGTTEVTVLPATAVPMDTHQIALQAAPWESGEHTLELSELPVDCRVTGNNPRTVTAVAGATALSVFMVTCMPPNSGTLFIRTATYGKGPAGYEISVDEGLFSEAMGPSDELTLFPVPVGVHTVTLAPVLRDCQLVGSNPRIVIIQEAGGFGGTIFKVRCPQ